MQLHTACSQLYSHIQLCAKRMTQVDLFKRLWLLPSLNTYSDAQKSVTDDRFATSDTHLWKDLHAAPGSM